MSDWKSTVAGILSGLIGTLTALMTFQVPSALLSPQQAHTWLWITVGCNLGAIVGRVWIGILTQNVSAPAVANALNQLAAAPGTGTPFTPADLTTTPQVKP